MISALQAVKDTLNKSQEGDSINELPKSQLTPILNGQNARIQDATSAIAEILNFSEKEGMRLKAAQEVLSLHGVKRDEHNVDNRIQIVINNGNSLRDPSEIENVLNPQRIIDI